MIKINAGKYRDFGGLLIGGLIFLVAFNLLIFLIVGDVNVDLTSDGKYSLSNKTLEFLENNNQQLNIRFFVSKDLKSKNPRLAEYAEYLRKLFVEYKNESNGFIDFSMVDVVPFENSQFEANKYGIEEFDFGDGVKYQYLGASFSNINGQFQSISQFFPERKNFVEDDITRMISVISKERKPYLGIISPLFNVIDENNPVNPNINWPFAKNMANMGYNIIPIRSETPVIDENIDVVLLLYPMNASTSLLYALDQYLVKGGNLVIMMDAFSEERFRDQEEYYSYRSGLPNFLKKRGISYNEDLLVGDNKNSRTVVMDGRKIQYPFKINITKNMLPAHVINENIDLLYYNHGGYFEYKKQDDLIMTVIAKTSDNGGVMQAYNVTDLGYEDLLKNYVYTNKTYILSLLVEGKFYPYYEYPPINDKELISRLPVYISTPQKYGKMLLLGDADIVNEALWNRDAGNKKGVHNIVYSSDNLLFLRNIFDYMSDSGYVSVGKKYIDKINESLFDVFQSWANDYYEDYRQETAKRLLNVKEKLLSIEANKAFFDAYSIKKSKEKELLSREETDANLTLRKITYLIGEKYKFYRIWFSVFVIFIMPLFVVLVVGGGYRCYDRIIRNKAKEYTNE